ncbi:hypothetical protein [Zobellella sp. DQSA1]|uniref:hypothetical protein n=1 Tax=Zobellella sp. DQSA1 TaxID=3342386 RepID=UPI0035BED376
MRSNGTTLIIDDKEEDGRPISEALRNICIPNLFFLADEQHLIDQREKGRIPVERVKIVIQDINLTGMQSPSKKDYDKAATFLENLLPDNNGPWLMIAWSTWADVEMWKNYPQELFQHLIKELPKDKRPYALNILDKSKFTSGGKDDHNEVLPYSDMTIEQKKNLTTDVETASIQNGAIRSLFLWENSVSEAVSQTIIDLQSLGKYDARFEQRVGKALYELAKAEAGKSITPSNARNALYRILNSQLLDRVTSDMDETCDICQYSNENGWSDIKEWKRKMNKFLHFDNSQNNSGPGTLYAYNSYLESLAECHQVVPGTELNIVKQKEDVLGERLIINTFISPIENSHSEHREVIKQCIENSECIVVDITPPCDHAQNKAEWKKFCAGILVDMTSLNKKQIEELNSIYKNIGFLWSSCDFSDSISDTQNSHKRLMFNSRVMFSIPEHELVKSKLKLANITKMREQISRDLTHWLSNQLSRPGYTMM